MCLTHTHTHSLIERRRHTVHASDSNREKASKVVKTQELVILSKKCSDRLPATDLNMQTCTAFSALAQIAAQQLSNSNRKLCVHILGFTRKFSFACHCPFALAYSTVYLPHYHYFCNFHVQHFKVSFFFFLYAV
jgi:hypothetical protein